MTYFVLGIAGYSWQAGIMASSIFGAIYLGVMVVAKVPEAAGLTRRLRLRR